MAAERKERVYVFDNLKGLLIAMVVMGHMVEPLANASARSAMVAFDFIYLFHMPLFIFVTGLFSKNAFRGGKYRAETPIFYFVLCFLMYTALYLERVFMGVNPSYNLLTAGGGSAPWYLLASGLYVLAVPFFARLNPRWAILGAVVLALYSGTVGATDYLAGTRLITFLPFFLLGFYLDPGFAAKRIGELKSRKGVLLIGLAAAALVAVAVFLACMNQDWLIFFRRLFTARNSFATVVDDSGLGLSRWWAMLARLLWYGVVPLIGLALLVLLPQGYRPSLSGLGARTLQVYFLHPFVTFACSHFGLAAFLQQNVTAVGATVLLLVGGFVLAWALSLPGCFQECFVLLRARIAALVDKGSNERTTE